MESISPAGVSVIAKQSWQKGVATYQTPHLRRSLWQVINTFTPFFGLLYLMYLSLAYSYSLTLVLALPTAGLLVRIFIILHDCGHGSFFKSMRANNLLGIFCGLLVFVPYHQWRFAHAIHHATSGDLDRRGTGDIITLTVEEYLQRTSWGRFKYRVYRHPLFLFCVAPMSLLLVGQRFVNVTSRRRERYAVYGTNLALLAMFTAIWLTIGLKTFVLIYAPVLLIASMALVYGFYVQHQFEEAYWQHHAEWDYVSAALQGSSYFKLPRVLQWFSGNIGLHHVHHLNSRIPNYALQQCHDDNAFFHQVTIITLRSSLKSLRLHLWDAKQGRLISFGELKTLQQQRKLTGET